MTNNAPQVPYLSSNEIRERFLRYFQQHQHEIIASSSLIPDNDPTLLFTNAGMVQFKDVFLGKDERPYHRAVSSQRCVRAGGKHNDLERVGYTARHHTFFEMLGNFSFGDYFKRDAIRFAWHFLTKELGLPAEKLWVSVYKDDTEAEDIWLNEMHIDPHRFSRCGDDDNFWSMGPTGPCGPCTEIFYDHGANIAGGPPGSPDADGDRYIEIWNLVFMQYDRDASGKLTPLPKPSVDTGMGLERISAIMQQVHNNYDIDSFKKIISAIAALGNITDLSHFSLRVIADHIRSCSFLIADGVLPSNEGRGYVLRRIIRRALRHGNQLGLPTPFFYQCVAPLADAMGEAYPELRQKQSLIEKTLRQEEEQFNLTLTQGLKVLEQFMAELKDTILPGELVFKLYDTYGFPADLTADICRERGFSIDHDGFEAAMTKQRTRSREASHFATDYLAVPNQQTTTQFTGYEIHAEHNADILTLYREGQFADMLQKGDKGAIVLDKTPFYAEAGGQVGDQGRLLLADGSVFHVADTIKQGQMHLHLGKVEKGTFKVGDTVTPKIDEARRAAIVLNHSATHLLHFVLKQTLGEHVIQKGSLVDAERLRFDFSHQAPLTPQELRLIEQRVNAEIRSNHAASVKVTSKEEALESGAVALFGEKYGNKVRVVHFGPSVELCGGTHADHTGNIGVFKIVSESGVAAGIRRIEAVTGLGALNYLEKCETEWREKYVALEGRANQLEKELQQSKEKMALLMCQDIIHHANTIGDIKLLLHTVTGIDGKMLRQMVDQLKPMLGKGVLLLATVKEGKIGLIGSVTDNLVDKINARDMINLVAKAVGGKGGGKADLAEGGGNQPEALPKAFETVAQWVNQIMNKQG